MVIIRAMEKEAPLGMGNSPHSRRLGKQEVEPVSGRLVPYQVGWPVIQITKVVNVCSDAGRISHQTNCSTHRFTQLLLLCLDRRRRRIATREIGNVVATIARLLGLHYA